MSALTPDQKAKLTAAGMSVAQIAQIESGAAMDNIVDKANRILNGDNSGYVPPFGGLSAWNTAPGQAIRSAPTPNITDIAGRSSLPTRAATPYPQMPTKVNPKSLGGWSPPLGPNTSLQTQSWHPDTSTNSWGGKYGTQEGAPGTASSNTGTGMGDNPYAMPDAPGATNFNIPTIEMRDFTEQAKKIAADAFAPYLAAFDIARTNAQAQGQTSKEATKGLYDNFVKDIAAKAAETAQRYDATKAEQATRGEAQQADIAENQQSANANVGNQLAALGLDSSAPTMLQQGANDQAFAQDQAAAGTESQQQFYDSQKLAQGNYDSQFGLLQQKAGISAQSDLDSQLMNLLSGIDINKANAQGEQGQTALSLAQTLADRDFQMQNANAGNSLQGQQLGAQQQQNQFENQLGLRNQWNQESQQEWDNRYKIGQLNAEAGSAGAEFDMGNYPGASRPLGILLNATGNPDLSDQTYKAIGNAFLEFANMPENANSSENDPLLAIRFAQYMAEQGARLAPGVPSGALTAAAREYVATAKEKV